MIIKGVYKFSASRELVWSLLQDPAIIRHSLPGCDEYDQIAASVFFASMSVQRGPFKGQYRGHVTRVNDVRNDSFGLTLDGQGPEGTILGSGQISLGEQDGIAIVRFEGDVEFSSFAAEKSPRMLRTTSNALIRQFFEAFDRQIQIQTGTYTTSLDKNVLGERRSGTIDIQDVVANTMGGRQTAWIVFSLIALVITIITGAFMILLLFVRWVKHGLDRRIVTIVHAKQQDIDPHDLS